MKLSEYLAKRDLEIAKSNIIIQKGRFSLSVREQRIILYLISQLDKYDKSFKEYVLSVMDMCRLLGIQPCGNAYDDIADTLKGLADKSMWLDIDNLGEEFKLVRWLRNCTINLKTNQITLKLDETMQPYLLELKKNFTTYELVFTLKFKSKYSFRLYEFIKSIHFHDLDPMEYKISIPDIKAIMGAEYVEFRDFNSRALQPALKEINEQTDKTISVEQLKSGNKVTALKFKIESKSYEDTLALRVKIERELGNGQISIWQVQKGVE